MQFKIYTIPVTSQSLVCVITPTVLRASHALFVWHHTQHRYSICCTIEDITSSLYEANHHFYDITPTIFDIKSTLSLSSHPLSWWYHTNSMRPHSLYMSASYPLYTTAYSLYLYQHSHCTSVSQPHFPWYHTLCIHDIAPTICLTSDILYKVSDPQFMTSHHIFYDITCTVFLSSLPQYLTLHQQNLCPHNPFMYDLWTTLCITSHPLYIWHLMHHT